MARTKWWKCDLQVATPAWGFTLPSTPAYDFSKASDREAFGDQYMGTLKEKGIEVIAIADHNSHEWLDDMKMAGQRHGIVVFPGCEITTGSGADGIHLLIIGDRSKRGVDFDRLLAGPLGFSDAHPRFIQNGAKNTPGSSRNTLEQILNDLPDDYLVIAPHALNDNGIASRDTARGDIRWKALHHERLNAVDPGDCSSLEGDAFPQRFRRRELDHFPALQRIAFVATSDAYSLADLGRRFCWIRMAEPTLEALRQAFLDSEARIVCNWDQRLTGYTDLNPNAVRQGWIRSVHLEGNLGNSNSSLTVEFHPGLNVIIGGRGSGKSTIVAALRQLYSGFSSLPPKVKEEAEYFAERIFSVATLRSKHLLPNSQEEQAASWTRSEGQRTSHADHSTVATTFPVRIINQKELFERVSQSKDDPYAASRSFLALVDAGLGLQRGEPIAVGSWWREFEQVRTNWSNAVRNYQKLKSDLQQLPVIRSKVQELEHRLAAFDSPEAKARREANDARLDEFETLDERQRQIEDWLRSLRLKANELTLDLRDLGSLGQYADEFAELKASLFKIAKNTRQQLSEVLARSLEKLETWTQHRDTSAWGISVIAARSDSDAYVQELRAQGIDPDTYEQLKANLASNLALSKQLAALEADEPIAREQVEQSWQDVTRCLEQRRNKRAQLLKQVGEKSGRLKFEIKPHRDKIAWASAVRELLNLRSDAFIEDIPSLSSWLWDDNDETERLSRWAIWRNALSSGDFTNVANETSLRSAMVRKLQSLDEALRLRLAVEVADDIVTMMFLKDGGVPTNPADWQVITEGSPGQRTAAMLGFVLHHGSEPLILDQPEDDLDTEWISALVVKELRSSRWKRQVIVVSHNANIPVNGDAEQVIVLENKDQCLQVRKSPNVADPTLLTPHCGPIEVSEVRRDIQNIMEGGITAFMNRERKYNNELQVSAQ